jgi:hypothetical protein
MRRFFTTLVAIPLACLMLLMPASVQTAEKPDLSQ